MKKIIYILIAAFLITSCIDIKLEDQFSDPDAITTIDTARDLLADAYGSFPQYQLEFSILGDDFVPTSLAAKNVYSLNMYNWVDKSIADFSYNVWGDYYMVLAQLNALIQRFDMVVTDGEGEVAELDAIKGEAYALKAKCYFDLLRIYAPAWSAQTKDADAIVLKDILELQFLPRSSLEKSVAEVERLLDLAGQTVNAETEVFWLSSDAVNYLKAEVALYKGEYDKVITILEPYIDGIKSHWTETSYKNLWTDSDSDERIFAPYIFSSYYYNDLSYDSLTGDYFCLSPDLTWNEDDIRAENHYFEFTINGRTVNQFGKYNKMYYDKITVRYVNMMRYSSICFMAAESYARTGKETEARNLLNLFLNAWHADVVEETVTGDKLIEAILAQKHKELLGEGLNWFDLKRLGKPIVIMDTWGSRVAKTIPANDYRWLFPIPPSEYKYNDFMTQNPEWPMEKVQ